MIIITTHKETERDPPKVFLNSTQTTCKPNQRESDPVIYNEMVVVPTRFVVVLEPKIDEKYTGHYKARFNVSAHIKV